MKSKFLLYFYILAIVMMYNDGLFTWIGSKTGVVFWRQIIWLIGMFALWKFYKKDYLNHRILCDVLYSYKVFFVIILFLSILTLVIDGFSVPRVLFALIEYSFGIPFLLFPLVCVKNGWSRSHIRMFFTYLGTFLSFGLIADYVSGGFFTSTFTLSVLGSVSDFLSGRHYFLSTTDSIFTVYFSVCLMCCLLEAHSTSSFKRRSFLIFLSFLFVFASIFCGARQTLVGMVITEFLGLYCILKSSKVSLFLLLTIGVVLYLLSPKGNTLLSDNEGYNSRYTMSAIKEDQRSETWKKGFYHCFLSGNVRSFFIGDGISFVTANKKQPGEVIGKHFENSFLARIGEMGVFWVSILLYCLYCLYQNIGDEIQQTYSITVLHFRTFSSA